MQCGCHRNVIYQHQYSKNPVRNVSTKNYHIWLFGTSKLVFDKQKHLSFVYSVCCSYMYIRGANTSIFFKMFYLMYALNPQYTSFGSANAFLIRMPWELYRPLCLLYVFTRLFNGRFYASIQSPSTMTLLFITPSMGLCRVPGDNSVRLPYFSVRGIHNCTKRAWAHPSLSCIC